MDISVVITTYNGQDRLGETIDAILSQTLTAKEVIVVNDGSTDGTREMLRRFGDALIVIDQPNAGVQAARNAGFARATAPYVAISDHDDLWDPRYLERQAALLAAEPGIEFCFGNFRYLREDGIDLRSKFDEAPQGWWDRIPRRVLPEGWVFDGSIAGLIFTFHPIFPSATIVSRALWKSIGGFDLGIDWAGGEDGDFTLRCLYRAKTAALPEPLALIHRHGTNQSANLVRRLLDEVRMLHRIRDRHPEAAPYLNVIAAEIRQRRLDAFDGAFASFDHPMACHIYATIPASDRSKAICVKHLISCLPSRLARPLNATSQRVFGGRVGRVGPILR